MNYFIKVEGESHGPLTAEQIRLRLSEQGLKYFDLVRTEDSTDWVPLSSRKEFYNAAVPLPDLDNPMATASVLLGIAPMFIPLLLMLNAPPEWVVPAYFFSGICAIIMGHLAVGKVRRSFYDVRGYRTAKVGLWLGYSMVLILPVAASFLVPTFSKTCAKGNQTKAISNCRQIITLLRMYSSDHDGKYPDGVIPDVRTSNEAFRVLFVDGVADSEMIFGSPSSVFNPDGNIGSPPDYLEALRPGENHWAMTRGLNDSMDGSYPLVYENPSDSTWPPKWNPNLAGTGKPGRTWSAGKIIIGMNDSSVSTQKLESDKGDRVGLKPTQDGKDMFTQNERVLDILNVAR